MDYQSTSVDVDTFATSTACCDLDLSPRAGLRHWGPTPKGHGASPLTFSPHLPLPFLGSRLPKYSLGVWSSAVNSPSGVWGEAPQPTSDLVCIRVKKGQLWWQQFVWSFSQNICNFYSILQ